MPARKPEPEKTPDKAAVRPDKAAAGRPKKIPPGRDRRGHRCHRQKAIEPVLIDLSRVAELHRLSARTSAHGSRGVRAIGEERAEGARQRGVYPISRAQKASRKGAGRSSTLAIWSCTSSSRTCAKFYDLEGCGFDARASSLRSPGAAPGRRRSRYHDDFGRGPEGGGAPSRCAPSSIAARLRRPGLSRAGGAGVATAARAHSSAP